YKYLSENIKYTNSAREQGITGKVILSFVVRGADGSITDVKVVRGLGYGLDEEAIKKVKAMPHWKPARQNGKEVSSTFTLPVDFRLDEE
ncbi:MAG TPA: energy transducer TonB, partial [Chitinophagaceae bacterium]|nr:energy transducer TonB [Chitinophagaceae bacterium]